MRQRTVSIEQASSGLEAWVRAAARGETVVITRAGRAVATLVGPPPESLRNDAPPRGLDPALVRLLGGDDSEETLRFLGEG